MRSDIEIERLQKENKRLRLFIGDLLDDYSEGSWQDIDGSFVQELLVKHGMVVEATLTEEDCDMEWAQNFDGEPGDTYNKWTPDTDAIISDAIAASTKSKKGDDDD